MFIDIIEKGRERETERHRQGDRETSTREKHQWRVPVTYLFHRCRTNISDIHMEP